MIRARSLSLAGALAATVLLAGCPDDTDTGINQLDLTRPVDIAFGCYGGLRITNGGSATTDQLVTSSAQPTSSCDFRSTPRAVSDPTPVPPGQEDLGSAGGELLGKVSWYGFILESAIGTVALSSFDTVPSTAFIGGASAVSVLDADPLTPGDNGVSVGENPVALAVDAAGCYLLTANAGSCDLSSLDITSVAALDGNSKVKRYDVMTGSGSPLRSRPAAMVAQPGLPITSVGDACPAAPSGLVYIAYPSCHAVAVVDVSSGTVTSSIQFDANGVATIGDANLTCIDECGGSASPTAGTRPVALDIFTDPRAKTATGAAITRLLIGADNLAAFTIVEIDPTTALPASVTQVPLEDPKGTLGLTQVALSPQLGTTGAAGIVNDLGPQFQFAYGVATDGSVRVADVLSTSGPAAGKECDTQVDPRLLHDVHDVVLLSCLPVGDPATPRRRPGATGPGITLFEHSTPISVATFKADNFADDSRDDTDPTTLKGYFGVITATDGRTYVFNIADDNYGDSVVAAEPLHTQIPLAIAHQLRDSLADRDATNVSTSAGTTVVTCDTEGADPLATTGNTQGAREVAAPVRINTTGNVGVTKVGELPSIRQVLCNGTDDKKPVSELSFAAPVPVRDIEFPDLRGLQPDETWSLTWEGALSLDTSTQSIDGPSIRTGMLSVQASDGMSLIDQTGPFCAAGVEPHDIVQLRGCDPSIGDADCPIGYTCFVHPDSKVSGLGACMLTDEAPRLADACKEFLISLRRYSVGRAKTGELVIVPRTHVLFTTPVDGCTDAAQCQSLADLADKLSDSSDPNNDSTAPDPHTWQCQADPTRAPIGGTGNRCVEVCETDANCTAGAVCEAGVCMDSVIPPQACVNSPQRYDLRASDAFAVVGTSSGYVHPIIADSGGTCVTDPNASPFQIGRIALAPPACDPMADLRTGKKPDGTYDANPCSFVGDEYEIDPQFVPGTCTLADPSTLLVDRQADEVRFHNIGMTLTIADPTYGGDKSCVLDRLGDTDSKGRPLGKRPLVYDGYQLSFEQTAGFTPLLLEITPSYPVRAVRGPTNSIWVVDDGDFLSTDVTVASTEGKVFRVEPVSLETVNILQ